MTKIIVNDSFVQAGTLSLGDFFKSTNYIYLVTGKSDGKRFICTTIAVLEDGNQANVGTRVNIHVDEYVNKIASVEFKL